MPQESGPELPSNSFKFSTEFSTVLLASLASQTHIGGINLQALLEAPGVVKITHKLLTIKTHDVYCIHLSHAMWTVQLCKVQVEDMLLKDD